jgi:hypothetical protein
MQASRIGLPHLEHGRIPISARLYNGLRWIDDIVPPCLGGSITDLSVADNCLFGRRWSQYALPSSESLVNIAHFHAIIIIASHAQEP